MRFKLEMLSEYRSAIMGFAIIWVVLYHFQMQGPLFVPFRFGFTGVDLFMFASGLGLYFSMLKNDNIKDFYKKRLLRILPIYYVLGFIYELLKGDFDCATFLWKYSTLGFWTNGVYGNGWFIPSIVTLYAFYPYIYRTLFRNQMEVFALKLLMIILFFFVFYICFVDQSLLEINHFFLLYRVPIFLMGSVIGFLLNNNKKHVRKYENRFFGLSILFATLAIVIFYIDHKTSYGIYLSTTFIAPIIMIILCHAYENNSVIKKIMGGGRKCFIRNLYDTSNTTYVSRQSPSSIQES